MTVDRVLLHPDGKKMFFNANIESTYSAIGASEVAYIMPDVVSSGIPVSAFSVTKASTTEYTEPVKPKAASGILAKDLFVPSTSALLGLGIVPQEITGTVSADKLPADMSVNVGKLMGLEVDVTLTSSGLNIPNTAEGQISTKAINEAVTVAAGQQLSATVGDTKLTIIKSALDKLTTIAIKALPNDSASAQLASITLPPGSSQVAIELKPKGVVDTSSPLNVYSPSSNPILALNIAMGSSSVGTTVEVDEGKYQIFPQSEHENVFLF
jgi:hypothetical protein